MLMDVPTTMQTRPPADVLPAIVPPLRSLYLYIAGACNLACRHCWIAPGLDPEASGGRFIPLEYVEKALRQAAPLGLSSVKLTGGEPMLHPRFRDIVTCVAKSGASLLMETNGTLLDAEAAQFLRDSRVMEFISVSLDGADAATHESLRGVAGSFDRAVAGIGHLVRAAYRPQMICTLHRGNLDQIEAVVRLAERLGCGSVKFNHVQPMGRGNRMADKEALSVEELRDIYSGVDRRFRRGSIPVHFDIPIAFRSVHELLRSPAGTCNILEILGILSGGEVALCGVGVEVAELVFGHLETDDLASIWQDAPGLRTLRATVPGGLEGICGECIHRDGCLGGCIAQNYHGAGRMSAAYAFCATAEALGLFPRGRTRPEGGKR
jgi:SynChlorMet cassette radical SAM/SPASM protein ScmF